MIDFGQISFEEASGKGISFRGVARVATTTSGAITTPAAVTTTPSATTDSTNKHGNDTRKKYGK